MTTNGALTGLYLFYVPAPSGGMNGGHPVAGLVLGTDGNFYGTTFGLGFGIDTGYDGTVFLISTNMTLTTLYHYSGHFAAGLVQGTDGNFYGTTVSDLAATGKSESDVRSKRATLALRGPCGKARCHE
jgi:hypothetical protein